LEALRACFNVSFAEKNHLPPVLGEALAQAQSLAKDQKRYSTNRKTIAGSADLLDAFLDRGRSLEPPDE
jgi:hypothetical protein